MSPPRARVIPAQRNATLEPLLAPTARAPAFRRIAREELEARLAAERLEQESRARCEALVADARARALAESDQAREQARQQAHTEGLAQWIAARRATEVRAGSDTDRMVQLAVVLAERLVGAELTLAPARIASIAEGVLAEARGARRATIDASPADASALRQHLQTARLGAEIVEVRDDPSLAPGALRIHTDVGILDAQLAPRLERLAAALRDALS